MPTNSSFDANEMTEQQIRELAERLTESGSAIRGGGSRLGGALGDLSNSQSDAANKLYEVSKGLVGMTQGSIQFIKAAADGSSKLDKYGAGIETAFDGLGDVVSSFGPIGMVVGALIKVIGTATKLVAERDQIYLDAYDSLSEFNGATGFTADELSNNAANLVLGAKSLFKLIKPANSLGTDVLALGSTAGEAQKKFLEIANISKETRAQYSRLGINQEQLAEIQADYIKVQSRTGALRSISDENLKKESLKYADQLVQQTALTGMTIDQQKQANEATLNDYRFQASLREHRLKGETDVVNRMQMADRRFTGIFQDQKLSEGFREILSDGVGSATEGGKMLRAITGEQIFDWAKQVKAGSMSQDDFVKSIQNSYKTFIDANGGVLKANEELRRTYGVSAQTIAALSKSLGDGISDQVASDVEARKNLKTDKLLEARISVLDTGTAVQNAFDEFINLISGPVNTVFVAVLHGLQALAEGFVSVLSRLGLIPAEMEFAFQSKDELDKLTKTYTEKIAALSKSMSESSMSGFMITEGPDAGTTYGAADEKRIDDLKARLSMVEKLARLKSGMSGTAAPAAPAAVPAPSRAGSATQAPASSSTNFGKPSNATPNAGYAKGGITSGSTSGHVGLMHGMEAVVPLPDGKSIPVNINIPQLTEKILNPLLDTGSLASVIDRYTSALMQSSPAEIQQNIIQAAASSFNFSESISASLDTLLDRMKQNTDLQSELLHYVKR